MSLGSLENPASTQLSAENDIDIGEVSGVIHTGLESLQEKWEPVSKRDAAFLSESERLFMQKHDAVKTLEATPEKIREYFNEREERLRVLNSSSNGDAMSSISEKSIEECGSFLDKVVNSTSSEEVSIYATELLKRVSRMVRDSVYNRNEVQKVKEAVAKNSYNVYGYDRQKTTEGLDDLVVKGRTIDDKFLEGFQDVASGVKKAVNTLATNRLQELQKQGQPGQKIETAV